MSREGARGLPIFWQTLILVLASLLVAQAVSIGLFLSLRPPRPDVNRVADLADALAGRPRDDHDHGLLRFRRAGAPVAGDMVSDPRFTALLAARLAVPAGDVRLFFESDQRGGWPFSSSGDRPVPIRRGEPLFFNAVVAAARTSGGWRVVETPPRPLIAAWQRRSMLWFALSALLLLPFVWFFARRLTRPIRRFAEAADRMGADPTAPAVAEEGAAELRIAAHALNRMQARTGAYVAERTAMIGAIAHDLRTPLARIAFRIEAAPGPIREKVQADVEQMRAMIAATIGFVRGQASPSDRGAVAVGPLIERLIAGERDMGRAVARGWVDPVMVTGDPVALGRLIQNLIDNAHAYGGGDVTVMAVTEADRVSIVVVDRGQGVPADQIERLFLPFERGDPSRNRATGGIGLGLASARAIAQAHGGTLTLAGRDGGGLAATVTLPIRNAAD